MRYRTEKRDLRRGVQVERQEEWRMSHKMVIEGDDI